MLQTGYVSRRRFLAVGHTASVSRSAAKNVRGKLSSLFKIILARFQRLGDAPTFDEIESSVPQLGSGRFCASDVPLHFDAAVEPVWVFTDPFIGPFADRTRPPGRKTRANSSMTV